MIDDIFDLKVLRKYSEVLWAIKSFSTWSWEGSHSKSFLEIFCHISWLESAYYTGKIAALKLNLMCWLLKVRRGPMNESRFETMASLITNYSLMISTYHLIAILLIAFKLLVLKLLDSFLTFYGWRFLNRYNDRAA